MGNSKPDIKKALVRYTKDEGQEIRRLKARVAELEEFIYNLGQFANGEGDVGNLIARRCHKILNPETAAE